MQINESGRKVWLSTATDDDDNSGATAPELHRLLPDGRWPFFGRAGRRGQPVLPEAMLTTTLILICAGTTRMARTGGFAGPDEPLDAGGRRDAARAGHDGATLIGCSPALAARQTGQAMALPLAVEAALADIDHGQWTGRTFDAVPPQALREWIADPAGGAPGGETMAQVQQRIGPWIDHVAGLAGTWCAITHPMVVRAALAHILDVPSRAMLAIDLAPLSRTRLSFNRGWRLQGIG